MSGAMRWEVYGSSELFVVLGFTCLNGGTTSRIRLWTTTMYN
jgi:hypothetical protein